MCPTRTRYQPACKAHVFLSQHQMRAILITALQHTHALADDTRFCTAPMVTALQPLSTLRLCTAFGITAPLQYGQGGRAQLMPNPTLATRVGSAGRVDIWGREIRGTMRGSAVWTVRRRGKSGVAGCACRVAAAHAGLGIRIETSTLLSQKISIAMYMAQICLGVCSVAFASVPLAQGVAGGVAHVHVLGLQLMRLSASDGYLINVLSAAVLYVLGKMTSNCFLGEPQDVSWLARWFFCGLLDGSACHYWFYYVQYFAETSLWLHGHIQQALVMNLASTCIFTPAFCAAFLALLSFLETGRIKGAMKRIRLDWRELTSASMKWDIVVNGLVFGLVLPALRVRVSMGAQFVYLVGLAIWDHKRAVTYKESKGGGSQDRDTIDNSQKHESSASVIATATTLTAAAAASSPSSSSSSSSYYTSSYSTSSSSPPSSPSSPSPPYRSNTARRRGALELAIFDTLQRWEGGERGWVAGGHRRGRRSGGGMSGVGGEGDKGGGYMDEWAGLLDVGFGGMRGGEVRDARRGEATFVAALRGSGSSRGSRVGGGSGSGSRTVYRGSSSREASQSRTHPSRTHPSDPVQIRQRSDGGGAGGLGRGDSRVRRGRGSNFK